MSDVRILSNMIAPWIICGACGVIAGWFIGRSRRYKKKWEDLKMDYAKRCCELTDALIEKKKLETYSANLKRENESIRDLALKYELLHADGHNNLRWIDHNIPFNEYRKGSFVAVVGSTSDGLVSFIVKLFPFDTNDPEDRDFAIREAEELIEIIQKF